MEKINWFKDGNYTYLNLWNEKIDDFKNYRRSVNGEWVLLSGLGSVNKLRNSDKLEEMYQEWYVKPAIYSIDERGFVCLDLEKNL